jgi:hypothetical protein
MCWEEVNSFMGVDGDGDFLLEVGVVGDCSSPAFIGTPIVETSCPDNFQGALSDKDLFGTFRWRWFRNQCVSLEEVQVCFH